MSEQRGEIERRVTLEQLEKTTVDISYKSLVDGKCTLLTHDIHGAIRTALQCFNNIQETGGKYKVPEQLSSHVVSLILRHSKDIGMVRFNECEEPKLAIRIRDRSALENGTWVSADDERYKNKFIAMVLGLQPSADNHFIRETYAHLCTELSVTNHEIREALIDGVHVPCKNGVYNRNDHTFLEWDDATFDDVYSDVAFIFKLAVAYNPLAKNTTITVDSDGVAHEPWDLDSFVISLFDDNPAMCQIRVQTFWEIAAHVISGYSEAFMWFWLNEKGISAGASGKSSGLVLFSTICGETNVCKSNINVLTDNQYGAATILGKMTILADEMEEGTGPITHYACVKGIMRMEEITLRNIYQKTQHFRPKMTMIQCTNKIPTFRSASESVFRAMRILPFEKQFATDRSEKKYIKHDYLKRESVAEQALRKILEEVPVHYSEEVLEAASAKKSIMEESLPAIQFMNELTSQYPSIVAFPVVPAPLLYDMFANWYEITNHCKTNTSAQTFWKQVQAFVNSREDWECVDGTMKFTARYRDYRINLDVFEDFPPNTDKRTWTKDKYLEKPQLGWGFFPSTNIFRNGIRYTGTHCDWMDCSFLEKYVLPDKDGTWHQQYEHFCNLLQNFSTLDKPSYEQWVWDYHCLNAYDENQCAFIRIDPDGIINKFVKTILYKTGHVDRP